MSDTDGMKSAVGHVQFQTSMKTKHLDFEFHKSIKRFGQVFGFGKVEFLAKPMLILEKMHYATPRAYSTYIPI